MHGIIRSIAISVAIAAAFGFLHAASYANSAPGWQTAVDAAARAVPEARILVVDVSTGHLLASHHLSEAAHTLAAPGSTLKPLILYGLLNSARWSPDRRVACNRKLVVAGHTLACTHPPAPPFNAREALAWSCNSYFAEVARSLEPGELGRLLRPTGLFGITGLAGNARAAEASAEFREPTNSNESQLTVLGVEGIRITPFELASAYRWLALQRSAHPATQASHVVFAGIEDSASFGMARQAGLGDVSIAGKTGTAEGTASSQTHGWFAGIAPADKPQIIVVVYLPAGRGADAAAVAAALLSHSPLVQR